MPELRVTESGAERVVAFDDGPLSIGRDAENDLVLSEVRASRRHCVVEACAQGHRIRDLGSSNGTYVNERRISVSVLRTGDVIRIGQSHMKVEAPPPAVRAVPVRRRPLRGAAFLIAPAALLVLGALALSAVGSRRDDEVNEAREALARYRLDGVVNTASLEDRVAALETYLDEYGSSLQATRAKSELVLARERLNYRASAAAAFDKVAAQAGSLSADELSYRYETLLRRFRDVVGFETKVTARIREIARRSKEEAERELRGVVAGLGDLLAKGDYAGAVADLNRFHHRHPRLDDTARETARKEMSRVLDRAAESYGALATRVDALRGEGKLDEAETELRAAQGSFTGTRFATQVRMKFESLRAARRSPSPNGEAVVAAKADPKVVRHRENIYLRAQEAEEMARAGMFTRALERFRQILPACKDPGIRFEIAGRIEDIERSQGLLARLLKTARDTPSRFGTVRLGGLSGRVSGADETFLLYEVRGATVQRRWAELSLAGTVALIRKLTLTPDDLLSLAIFRFDRNDRDGWIETLAEAMEHEELKEAIDALFARKEGIGIPAGGFVSHRGRILSRGDYEREQHEQAISEKLQAFASGLDRLDELPNFRGVTKMLERYRKLEAARKYALDLIFDEKRYFYPYQHRIAEYTPVQREVDARVAAVRKIWDDPLKITLRRSPEATSLVKKLEGIAADLKATYHYGVRPLDVALARRTLYMPEQPVSVTIREFPSSRDHVVRMAYDRRVLDHNAALGGAAEASEIRQVLITNEYRIMLGRTALVRDDRLVLSARGHSQEMAKEGYFGHFSPHPERREPIKRMRLQGYRGMPVGENCNRGADSPGRAHDGWCHSSGHHRGLLQRSWTEMGTGRSGRLWTQNFGRTKPLPEQSETKEDSGPR